MRFCSIVGQASIQTAGASGPSTMERSRGLRGRAGAVTGERLPPPLGVEAPGPRARGRDVEPEEAEQDGGVPLIEHRPEALWCVAQEIRDRQDRKSTRLNSSHVRISYAVFCLKKKKR